MTYDNRRRRDRRSKSAGGEYSLTCCLGLIIGIALLAVAAWFVYTQFMNMGPPTL